MSRILLPDGTVINSKILAVTPVNKEYEAGQVHPHRFTVLLEGAHESLEIGGISYENVCEMRDQVLQMIPVPCPSWD